MFKDSLKKFWQSKGFYVALTVVILGSVLASYLAVNTMLTELGTPENLTLTPQLTQEDITWDEPITEAEVKEENVPITPLQPQSEAEQAPSTQTQAQTPQSQSSTPQASSSQASPSSEAQLQLQEPADIQPTQSSLYTLPVQGTILQAFSGAELVYNQTMGDWRTHNGIDISCEVSDTITSPAALTVKEVTEGGQWGTVVSLTDSNYEIRISGLGDVSVKAGDTLKQSQAIGKAAAFPAEMALNNHIHVEVLKNGEYINPEEIFSFAGIG